LKLIYLSALNRHPEFPTLPTIGELGRDDEGKQILDFFASSSAIGRTLVASPGVPPERIAALRRAMAATLADPALRTFAAERNMPIESGSAEEIEAIVRKVLATPKSITERTTAVLQSMRSSR
jgi:tripartite-type tricarboxylate transporter receptor subunit TctC